MVTVIVFQAGHIRPDPNLTSAIYVFYFFYFKRRILYSPRLYLFDPTVKKNNIMKYHYDVKNIF